MRASARLGWVGPAGSPSAIVFAAAVLRAQESPSRWIDVAARLTVTAVVVNVASAAAALV